MRTLVAVLLALAAVPAAALDAGDVAAVAAVAGHDVRGVVKALASDRLDGRDNDTPQSAVAQQLLLKRLRRLGVGPMGGADPYRQPFVRSGQTGTNLLAVIPGRELPDEYVVVGAHYDHLDTRSGPSGACSTGRPPGGGVCHGATDNAAGVAAVLALGKALRKLPAPPRRSVVLALWDAEEDGLVGSAHYVAHPAVPLAATRAYVNFDILGSDLLPSVAAGTFAIGAETGTGLAALVDAAAAPDAIAVRRLSFIFGQLRSDYANFVAAGVPTVFFSDATNGCYHTIFDDLSVVDWRKLSAQGRVAFRLTVALAEAASPPAFRAPDPALATYADAQVLDALFAVAIADLPRFAPADQATIRRVRSDLDAIVAAGPGAFDANAVVTVLNAALQSLDAIAHLGCLRRG